MSETEAPVAAPPVAERWVGFRLGEQGFALDVMTVQEVLCLPAIAPLPGAAPLCLGVINLRGHIIPVIDLRRLLGLPAAPADESSRLLVVDDRDEAVALQVDAVGEVMNLSPAEIDAEPGVGETLCPGQLRGVTRRDEALLLLLDTPALLSHAASSLAAAGR